MQARRVFLFLCSWALLPVVQSKQCTRDHVMPGWDDDWWSWSTLWVDLSGCATLHLSGSRMGDEDIRPLRALAEALKTNSALTALHLYGSRMGDEGSRALAEALKTNSALTTLHLGGNRIGDEGAWALAEALKTNSALTTLHLSGNSLGDEGAWALAEALKTNSALTRLPLSRNRIGAEGARALAEALKTNSALTTLRLYFSIVDELDPNVNSIGAEGARALAEAAAVKEPNDRLQKVDLCLRLFDAKAAEEKAAAERAAAAQVVEQKAKTLGLHAVFQELGIASGFLARAVQWCSQMGADTAAELAYLKREEVDQLVESLGLTFPILKQRQIAARLAAAFKVGKDEV